MDFVWIILEYAYIVFMISSAVAADWRYRLAALGGLVVFSVLGWATRRKWMGRLKEKNAGRAKIKDKKYFYLLVGEVVWVCLVVFDFLFLDTIPAFLFWKNSGDKTVIYANVVIGVLVIWSIMETNLDLVITGEERSPHWLLRITPVSVIAVVVTLVFYEKLSALGGLVGIVNALQALFLLELAVNLGVRYFVNKKKIKMRV